MSEVNNSETIGNKSNINENNTIDINNNNNNSNTNNNITNDNNIDQTDDKNSSNNQQQQQQQLPQAQNQTDQAQTSPTNEVETPQGISYCYYIPPQTMGYTSPQLNDIGSPWSGEPINAYPYVNAYKQYSPQVFNYPPYMTADPYVHMQNWQTQMQSSPNSINNYPNENLNKNQIANNHQNFQQQQQQHHHQHHHQNKQIYSYDNYQNDDKARSNAMHLPLNQANNNVTYNMVPGDSVYAPVYSPNYPTNLNYNRPPQTENHHYKYSKKNHNNNNNINNFNKPNKAINTNTNESSNETNSNNKKQPTTASAKNISNVSNTNKTKKTIINQNDDPKWSDLPADNSKSESALAQNNINNKESSESNDQSVQLNDENNSNQQQFQQAQQQQQIETQNYEYMNKPKYIYKNHRYNDQNFENSLYLMQLQYNDPNFFQFTNNIHNILASEMAHCNLITNKFKNFNNYTFTSNNNSYNNNVINSNGNNHFNNINSNKLINNYNNRSPNLDKYNPKDFYFNGEKEGARESRFYVIKSYSKEDVIHSIKHGIWCSTENGNLKLNQAFNEIPNRKHMSIYLFFSVNTSGQFCGLAEMTSKVDFETKSNLWTQDKWVGKFDIKWIFIKDIPNTKLRHIILPNNENKPVTNSRDAQEVLFDQAMEVLKVFRSYNHKSTILDDVDLDLIDRNENSSFKIHSYKQQKLQNTNTNNTTFNTDKPKLDYNYQHQHQQQQQQPQPQIKKILTKHEKTPNGENENSSNQNHTTTSNKTNSNSTEK